MPYEVREEEKAFWDKDTWTVKEKVDGEVKRVEKPVTELRKSHVKNIIKYINKRYNKIYKETYIDGSKLWLALNKQAETNPLDLLEDEPEPKANANAQQVPEVNTNSVAKQTMNNLIEAEITGIENGNISLDEVKEFLSVLQIKLNSIL